MVMVGRRLSAEELSAVRADPASAEGLLYGDVDGDEAGMPDSVLDLDKAWHGIHFLLTGTAWEISEGAGSAILGGAAIGPDNGYGPARLLDPDAVRAVAGGLARLDVDTLRRRFDADAMAAADIYPSVWSNGIEEFDGYLAPYVDRLRQFYRAAGADGQAVLLVIT